MNSAVTLLYVDDEPINLTIFEINFNKQYNVITAESGKEGLAKLNDNTDIIIVISDMRMPEMDGIEFIKEARTKYKHVGYFILTGFDITEEISEALDSKIIHEYFRKPFDINEIEKAVNKFLSSLDN